MTNIMNIVQFPGGTGGIGGLIINWLSWFYGWAGIGLAIILLAATLRIIMLPLDFGMKFFQKKQQLSMAKIKPEDDAIKQAYAGDPMGMQRARQELFRKHGTGGMGGMCLFFLLNMVVMIVVFFSAFQAMNSLSGYNLRHQFEEVVAIHHHHVQEGTWRVMGENGEYEVTSYWRNDINAAFRENQTGFMWVSNIWRPDTFWARQVLPLSEFEQHASGLSALVGENAIFANWDELRDTYNEIWPHIDNYARRMNGTLLFVALAGITTYLSIWFNGKMQAKNKAEQEKREQEAGYSIRAVKNEDPNKPAETLPTVDPAQMMGMMKFMMPAIMVIFTLTMTASMAVWIIAGSLTMAAMSMWTSPLAGKLAQRSVDKADAKKSGTQSGDRTQFNPHSKYFKTTATRKPDKTTPTSGDRSDAVEGNEAEDGSDD